MAHNSTGEFNTWYAKSTDGGATWGAQVKLSNLTSGAPYKDPDGYTFTDGDYFGIAVSSTGVAANSVVTVPPFTPGTTSPVVVTATKIDQTMGATVALSVTDVAGNVVKKLIA